ncbi:MAG: hypothetical protein AAB532_04190 [Patescibacteria group bacterium]
MPVPPSETQHGAPEQRDRITNSQIAIGLMSGMEGLIKADPRARNAAVSALFDPNGYTTLRVEITANHYSDLVSGHYGVSFDTKREEDGSITRTLEFEDVDGYTDPTLVVSVTRNKGKDTGALTTELPDTGRRSLVSPRSVGLGFLDGFRRGGFTIVSVDHLREDRIWHTADSVEIDRDQETPQREELILGLIKRIQAAEAHVKSEDGFRASRARREIADLASSAFSLGAGFMYRGFIDREEGLVPESRQSIILDQFNPIRGIVTLEPFAYLDAPVTTPHGKQLTQMDAILEKDGVFLYRTGKDGIDWTKRIGPTDEQIIQLHGTALSKLVDFLYPVRPSARQRERKIAAL